MILRLVLGVCAFGMLVGLCGCGRLGLRKASPRTSSPVYPEVHVPPTSDSGGVVNAHIALIQSIQIVQASQTSAIREVYAKFPPTVFDQPTDVAIAPAEDIGAIARIPLRVQDAVPLSAAVHIRALQEVELRDEFFLYLPVIDGTRKQDKGWPAHAVALYHEVREGVSVVGIVPLRRLLVGPELVGVPARRFGTYQIFSTTELLEQEAHIAVTSALPPNRRSGESTRR